MFFLSQFFSKIISLLISQAFHTDHEMALEELFGDSAGNSRKFDACLNVMATRIATVFASLKVIAWLSCVLLDPFTLFCYPWQTIHFKLMSYQFNKKLITTMSNILRQLLAEMFMDYSFR